EDGRHAHLPNGSCTSSTMTPRWASRSTRPHPLTRSRVSAGSRWGRGPQWGSAEEREKPRGCLAAREVRDERRADRGRRLAACGAAATRTAVGGCERETGAAVGGYPWSVAREMRQLLDTIAGVTAPTTPKPTRPPTKPRP